MSWNESTMSLSPTSPSCSPASVCCSLMLFTAVLLSKCWSFEPHRRFRPLASLTWWIPLLWAFVAFYSLVPLELYISCSRRLNARIRAEKATSQPAVIIRGACQYGCKGFPPNLHSDECAALLAHRKNAVISYYSPLPISVEHKLSLLHMVNHPPFFFPPGLQL